MASLYKRARSPYWWIKYKTATGRVIRKAAGLRVDSLSDTRKAQAMAHDIAARELRRAAGEPTGRWDGWVENFLKMQYGDSPKTHQRYRLAWRNLLRFLEAKDVSTPSMLTYNHCISFLEWRQVENKKQGNYAASHNTALTEIKVMGVIMGAAKKRGYADTNPCLQLGIKRTRVAEKPEIPGEHLALIRDALQSEPEWMQVSFAIGLNTGLRLSETNVWMPNVDLERQSITVENAKGGPTRSYTLPFDETLAPLLTRLKRERPNTTAFDWPKNLRSKEWFVFFQRMTKEHGMPHYCFHCLRVSFITRGARAGVPENVMMKLANHASTTVHRIYQRLKIDDVRKYLVQLHPQMDKPKGGDHAP